MESDLEKHEPKFVPAYHGEEKPRRQVPWSQQAGCQWAKGDNYPNSECLAPADNECRQRNTKMEVVHHGETS